MKRILTNHLLIPAGVILLFAFGDTSQSSFSQQVNKQKEVSTESTKAVMQDRRFKIDTVYLNQLVESKRDSLKKEYEVTEISTSKGREIIKVQKRNQSNLREVRLLLNTSLKVAKRDNFSLPEIDMINAKKKPVPLPVGIDPVVNRDTLVVPVQKKKFLRFLKFWK